MPRMTSRLSPVQSVRLRQLAVTLSTLRGAGRLPVRVMLTLYQNYSATLASRATRNRG